MTELSKEAQRALTGALAPGETPRASVSGMFGSAIGVTDRRVLVFRRLAPFGSGSIAAWPARGVTGISLAGGLLSVGVLGDAAKINASSPSAITLPRAMTSGYSGYDAPIAALRSALLAAQTGGPADTPPPETPLSVELAGLTQGWQMPALVRTYKGDDDGRRHMAAETQLLAMHGYRLASQSQDGGHFHGGRLILTGGLSVLAGSKGTRSKGSTTVTFEKIA